jgi:phosphotransferase family enzyme
LDDEVLSGGNMGAVVRRGDTVLREAGFWTPAVHRLLDHLLRAGVGGVPVPLGLAEDGREILGYVPGVVPSYPLPGWVWDADALDSGARLLRQVHDATAGVDLLGLSGPWRSPVRLPSEVVCHNDFATYNLVFSGTTVVGAIDWDFASPGPRLWDLAYLAYRIVPLTTDDWGDGFGEEVRAARLARLLGAYGSDAASGDVLEMVRRRLVELAEFSDAAARRLGKPELSDHARLYRYDAEHLPLW